jgi:23S rRNA (cytosine1962-C5)-methyltransferase
VETVLLKKGKEKSLLNRHPWVYSGALQSLPQAQDGEVVELLDAQKNFLGYGFFSEHSQISLRMFEFDSQNYYPERYWLEKLKNAFSLRKKFVVSPQTNSYRLLNAEGDFFPGIIADVYDQVVVLQVLIKGTEKILPWVVEGLKDLGFEHIYLKTKEVSERIESVEKGSGWICGLSETQVLVKENGLKFWVDFAKSQKTGFFLDQRDNRQLLESYSKGRTVLNTFSFSAGFSVYALRGGAAQVDSVDSSAQAIELGNRNVAENFGADAPHQSHCEECFDFLRKIEPSYDLMVLDPPAFAKTSRAVPNASRGYKDLNLLAFRKIRPGGILFTFSCSQKIDRDLFRKIVFAAAADSCRQVRILHQLSQPVDHPINIFHPENEYLKGLVLYVS